MSQESGKVHEAKERLLAVRLPQSLLDSIDEQVATMRNEVPWVQMTRSDVVRWILAAGLERCRRERREDGPATG